MLRLAIAGGGFAGLWSAMTAAAERHQAGLTPGDLAICLINDGPDLIIRPGLYEGALDEYRVPLAPLLAGLEIEFLESSITGIDTDTREITTSEGLVSFDQMVLATGSRLRMPPIPGAEEHGFDVDSFAAAQRLDAHLKQQAAKDGPMTVIVLGAGFSGLEVATDLTGRFPGKELQVILVDPADTAGQTLGDSLQEPIREALEACAVDCRLGVTVREIDANGLTLGNGERIEASATILTTGMEASPLTRLFTAEPDRYGRLPVNRSLVLESYPEVIVAGDTALAFTDDSHTALMSCQHAIQMGRAAGHNAVRKLLDRPLMPYRQEFYATCLDLGPAGAVFSTGWDRVVSKQGDDAKALKRQIVREWIMPPAADMAPAEIFKLVSLEEESNAA